MGDWPGSGKWWRPHSHGSPFRQIGLDASGKPVGDQVWAAFRGGLGDTVENIFKGATYFNGNDLSPADWAFVETVLGLANILDLIPSKYNFGDAPTGPAARPWVTSAIVAIK